DSADFSRALLFPGYCPEGFFEVSMSRNAYLLDEWAYPLAGEFYYQLAPVSCAPSEVGDQLKRCSVSLLRHHPPLHEGSKYGCKSEDQGEPNSGTKIETGPAHKSNE